MVCNIVNDCKNYKHYLLALEIQCALALRLECITSVFEVYLKHVSLFVIVTFLFLIGLYVFKDVPEQHRRPGLQTALLQNRQQTIVTFHGGAGHIEFGKETLAKSTLTGKGEKGEARDQLDPEKIKAKVQIIKLQ
jgi:hypothetical protein